MPTTSINKKMLMLGILFIFIGFFIPTLLTVDRLNITDDLLYAIRNNDGVYLIGAAVKLAGLNIIRCLPIYWGTFIIADAIKFLPEKPYLKILKGLTMFFLILLLYQMMDHVLKIHYDFSLSAICMIVLIVLFSNARYDFVSSIKKLITATFFISAVQLTDIMPALSFLPVGRGSVSLEVKVTADFLDRAQELQITTTILFCLSVIVGGLMLGMIRDENALRKIDILTRENQQIRMEARWQELENRSNQEMRHLVHDLRSPLTSCQALITFSQDICKQEGNHQLATFLSSAEQSIDRMNTMISDILSEQHKQNISTQEIIDSALAQLSESPHSFKLSSQNDAPDALVYVNKVRFTRALVNLIENAFLAVDDQNGKVLLMARQGNSQQEDTVEFLVIDNGCGIDKALLSHIWEPGVSTRQSYGLGLNFVRKVVGEANGSIHVSSQKGNGAIFTIQLPKGHELL